ncbi:MAG: molybdopterin-guanine dinucleotide biosynthesis protein B [bacterium]
MQIVSIIGKSANGKTTLIEKLVKELKKRGYRVGTIKHSTHGFEIDKKGKDSYKHKEAGADTVVIASPTKLAFVKEIIKELTIDQIARAYLSDMDIILTEGYKHENKPKIEVFRQEAGHKEFLCSDSDDLIAIVTNCNLNVIPDVPRFAMDDVCGVVNFLEEKHIK